MDQILQWFEANAGKIIFLLVAIVAALLITKGLARVMRKVLDRTDMPSASIFINIMRVLVWILAASIVLQPVFGISPTTLMTALGVGGIAVSLGLKDTVANVISGFGLMLGKVIQPGDLVSVAGTAGVAGRHHVAADGGARAQWQQDGHTQFRAQHRVAGEAHAVQ